MGRFGTHLMLWMCILRRPQERRQSQFIADQGYSSWLNVMIHVPVTQKAATHQGRISVLTRLPGAFRNVISLLIWFPTR
eukprot:2364341-Rhodomonas_salina.1